MLKTDAATTVPKAPLWHTPAECGTLDGTPRPNTASLGAHFDTALHLPGRNPLSSIQNGGEGWGRRGNRFANPTRQLCEWGSPSSRPSPTPASWEREKNWGQCQVAPRTLVSESISLTAMATIPNLRNGQMGLSTLRAANRNCQRQDRITIAVPKVRQDDFAGAGHGCAREKPGIDPAADSPGGKAFD